MGARLEEVLQEHDCHVTVVESYGRYFDIFWRTARDELDLVIAANSSLPPAHLQSLIPDIRAQNPLARLLVLSGYCPEGFIADLKQKGMDGFLRLPYEEEALLKEVGRLLFPPAP